MSGGGYILESVNDRMLSTVNWDVSKRWWRWLAPCCRLSDGRLEATVMRYTIDQTVRSTAMFATSRVCLQTVCRSAQTACRSGQLVAGPRRCGRSRRTAVSCSSSSSSSGSIPRSPHPSHHLRSILDRSAPKVGSERRSTYRAPGRAGPLARYGSSRGAH